MSKTASNPFFEFDFSKMMDFSKFADASKLMGEFKMPGMNIDACMATYRKNLEAFSAANQMAVESWQTLASRQADLIRQNIEAATSLMQALASCPTPEEKAAKQAEATRAAMERCLANVKDISDTINRNQCQALEVVSTRVCDSMDEWQNIVKSCRTAA